MSAVSVIFLGTSESDSSFNYDKDHQSDSVSVCVCPPLYLRCAKLDRAQRDGAGLIASHLNVGQRKVASEGKWIKVGSSPPPLFLVLSPSRARDFWQGHLSPPVGRG